MTAGLPTPMTRALPLLRDVLTERPHSLAQRFARGMAFDARELDDREYRGISLGLPGWVDRLAWKTFKKVFHRDPATGHLRGWNVRMRQDGLEGSWQPMRRRDGEPRTFGHFRVVDDARDPLPLACAGAPVIDYGLGGNPLFDLVRRVRDPLVSLSEGTADVLLGVSVLDLGLVRWTTPSWFLLVRDVELTHVHAPPREP